MEKNDLDARSLYDKCNTDGSDCVNLKELIALIKEIEPEIQTKQTKTIYRYLDIDKNGQVTKQEFVQQINKARGIEDEEPVSNLQQASGVACGFEEEEDECGDQALGPGPSKKDNSKSKLNLSSLSYDEMNFQECV